MDVIPALQPMAGTRLRHSVVVDATRVDEGDLAGLTDWLRTTLETRLTGGAQAVVMHRGGFLELRPSGQVIAVPPHDSRRIQLLTDPRTGDTCVGEITYCRGGVAVFRYADENAIRRQAEGWEAREVRGHVG